MANMLTGRLEALDGLGHLERVRRRVERLKATRFGAADANEKHKAKLTQEVGALAESLARMAAEKPTASRTKDGLNRTLVAGNAGKGGTVIRENISAPTRTVGDETLYAYYPANPEHAKAFLGSMPALKVSGPSEAFPGAAGVATTYNARDMLTIFYIQGCFRQKDESGNALVPRNIATQHGGWRQHILRSIFEREKQGAPRPVQLLCGHNARTEETERIFKEIAGLHGFAVERREEREGHALVARPVAKNDEKTRR